MHFIRHALLTMNHDVSIVSIIISVIIIFCWAALVANKVETSLNERTPFGGKNKIAAAGASYIYSKPMWFSLPKTGAFV